MGVPVWVAVRKRSTPLMISGAVMVRLTALQEGFDDAGDNLRVFLEASGGVSEPMATVRDINPHGVSGIDQRASQLRGDTV